MSIRVDSNLISLALAATRMDCQPNSTETGAISFLIQVAGELDVMDSEESLKLMEALNRMIGLIELAIGSHTPPSAILSQVSTSSTHILPPATISATSADSRTNFFLTLDPINPLFTTISSNSSGTARRLPILAKRVNLGQASEQEDRSISKEVKNTATYTTLPTASMIGNMFGNAILSASDKRATRKQILDYISSYSSSTPQFDRTRMGPRIYSTLTGRACFERMNIGPNGPAKQGCYWRIVDGVVPGPFEGKETRLKYAIDSPSPSPAIQPDSWRNLITQAVLFHPGDRITSIELYNYLREK